MSQYIWSPVNESDLSLEENAITRLEAELTEDTITLTDSQSNKEYIFCFNGIYCDKAKRINLLMVTFKKLHVFGNDIIPRQECFLTAGLQLNKHESDCIIKTFAVDKFFSLVKFMFVQNCIREGRQDGFRIVRDWREPEEKFALKNKNTKRERFHLFDQELSINLKEEVFPATRNSIWLLSGHLQENAIGTLCDSPWNKYFNHARYRIAKHIVSFATDNKVLEKFVLRQGRRFVHAKKRFAICCLQEEKAQKKMKITMIPSKKGAHKSESNENTKEESNENMKEQRSLSEDTTSKSSSDSENQEQEVLTISINHNIPDAVLPEEENSLPALPETMQSVGQENLKTYGFRGPERWGEVTKVFKSRHEPVTFTKTHRETWLAVFVIGVALSVLIVLIDYGVLPMLYYDIYHSHDLIAVLIVVIVAIVLSFRKQQKWSNFLMFACFCFVSLWAGKGRRKEFKFPAISYACCSLAAIIYNQKKKWMITVPATLFLLSSAVAYFFSLIDLFSRSCVLFFTANSFFVEYRQGESQVHNILVAPIRDICLILCIPLYMLLGLFG